MLCQEIQAKHKLWVIANLRLKAEDKNGLVDVYESGQMGKEIFDALSDQASGKAEQELLRDVQTFSSALLAYGESDRSHRSETEAAAAAENR